MADPDCFTLKLLLLPSGERFLRVTQLYTQVINFIVLLHLRGCHLTFLTTVFTICCRCLPSGPFQAMTLFDNTATSLGVRPPFAVKSQRFAALGTA